MGPRVVNEPSILTPSASLSFPDDLTILLHAAVDQLTTYLDRAAVDMGLNDARDWLVLAALDDGQHRTQLELSRVVSVDKTTLITVLDRLEKQQLIVRTVDPSDRRVRIPQITDTGRGVYATFATARDAAEARALDGVSAADRAVLLDILGRIARGPDAEAATSS
ncbi:MarR family winged helix-turn-helix transcriptional regulator [Aeromicrobium fastidiosum]|nr:MarR family transcriptional regulator [Aeromicrobium fastidiosum]MBP2389608.1 DNA-binding MarR family transcriptional regulator [Aeromicrobium fastidiosum]